MTAGTLGRGGPVLCALRCCPTLFFFVPLEPARMPERAWLLSSLPLTSTAPRSLEWTWVSPYAWERIMSYACSMCASMQQPHPLPPVIGNTANRTNCTSPEPPSPISNAPPRNRYAYSITSCCASFTCTPDPM